MLITVIIFLREAIEAALIISVLLAVSSTLIHSKKWILLSILIGSLGAAITAYNLSDISDLIDGTGQEVMNSGFLLAITILLNIVCIWLSQYLKVNFQPASQTVLSKWIVLVLIICAGIAITHEGCELTIYTYSFIQTHESYLPLIIGGVLGLGIGASVGAIIYYFLINIRRQTLLKTAIFILIMIAAGMSSQAALYLIQSGWLPSQLPLWDTTDIISEQSLVGQLLYALIGYEASPSLIQLMFYLAVIIISIASMIFFNIVTDSKSKHILLS